MKTRRTRAEIIGLVDSIVRSIDRDAVVPEVMLCRARLLMWWQDGRGRRLIVDVGQDEIYVELVNGRSECVSCALVQPGRVTLDGRRLDLWSLVRAGYAWMRAPGDVERGS